MRGRSTTSENQHLEWSHHLIWPSVTFLPDMERYKAFLYPYSAHKWILLKPPAPCCCTVTHFHSCTLLLSQVYHSLISPISLTIVFATSQASAAPARAMPDTARNFIFQELRRSEHSEDFRSSAPEPDTQSATSASGFNIDLPGVHELAIATTPNGGCQSFASSFANDGGSSSSASSSSQGQDCAADASAQSGNGPVVDGSPSAPANNDLFSSLDLNSWVSWLSSVQNTLQLFDQLVAISYLWQCRNTGNELPIIRECGCDK